MKVLKRGELVVNVGGEVSSQVPRLTAAAQAVRRFN